MILLKHSRRDKIEEEIKVNDLKRKKLVKIYLSVFVCLWIIHQLLIMRQYLFLGNFEVENEPVMYFYLVCPLFILLIFVLFLKGIYWFKGNKISMDDQYTGMASNRY